MAQDTQAENARQQGNQPQQPNKITFYKSDNRRISDAIDRLVVRIYAHKESEDKKIVLLTGGSSYCGNSMVAINTAVALSFAGWRTLLVDADLRKGYQYKRLAQSASPGLCGYLDGKAEIQQILTQTNYENLYYIAGGTSELSPVRLLCSERMGAFMEFAKTYFDFVIIDSPSVSVVPDATVLFPSVDGVVLITALGITTTKQLATARKVLELQKDKYYGTVINRVDMFQYAKIYPQYNYFYQRKMDERHKKQLRQNAKTQR